MADFNKFIPHLFKLEGGFSNHKNDKGGATNKGITFNTLKLWKGKYTTIDDLMNLSDEEAAEIYKTEYWNACKADLIKSQKIANLLVDYAVNSGPKTAIKALQRCLGVAVDGVVGNQTLTAVNSFEDDGFVFNALMDERWEHYYKIVARDESQRIFLDGWLNRCKYWENVKID